MKRRRIMGLVQDLAKLLAVYLGRGKNAFGGGDGPAPRVAVVLGSQVLSGGRPSRTLEARSRHAAGLYAAGEVDLIIPTGGVGEHSPSEAEVMGRILRAGGVQEEAILREDAATSTWDSAWLVADMARRRGIGEVRVVTDPLHCVRTVSVFRETGLVVWAEPVYGSPMWRKPWSRLGQLVREMGALVWYRTWHGVGARSRR